ncbi:short-chain dehydrogenase [Kaistia algarum]|uniref:SDR family oxidoreductase n=1 Tax=Kaistia algarum TaxID=2083279 RepID=UPI000CE7F4C8|nr:SDR family oxidoreductase [Kaistia algarum]MCX5516311.1 SDR family oxidoreductase [Kaistia algarum]PPE78768.1 short-chain dehydrogenase [Kaistia algarum]
MRNLWDQVEAAKAGSELDRRVYSSRLIGSDPALVLHGGGNTSLKGRVTDRFGDTHEAIWVKASGFDLGAMGREGFTALDLPTVLRLAELEQLSDTDMVSELKRARFDPSAAAASIEAIVHALIPFVYVDHSHADGVLTLSNGGGRALLERVYGQRVLILAYVKPGFDLARQIRAALLSHDLSAFEAILLEHHGVFTWGSTARESYDRMVAICAEAEDWLAAHGALPTPSTPPETDPVVVATLRGAVSRLAGRAMISLPATALPPEEIAGVAERALHGTLTPEHVIHNKPFPAVVNDDPLPGLQHFAEAYRAYVGRAGNPDLVPLSPHPHWALLSDGAVRSFGPTLARARVSADVARATVRALRTAGRLGHWQGLSESELRDLEYWELEQAKLKAQGTPPPLAGKIAVVTGAAAGIGRACAELLRDRGAVVVGIDLDPSIRDHMNRPGYDGVVADLRSDEAVTPALDDIVRHYGGVDILVSNAGIFRAGAPIEALSDVDWDDTLEVNLTSHWKLLKHAVRFLRLGIDPSVVFIGSRNVAAPGAGAAAYSVSKAGLTQLMRVAALELAPAGVTVNAVHPDAVFDTRLWTEEALETSARRYGITVAEYKSRNLMRAEVKSTDVARAVAALVDGTFSRTTGAQIPVDGGNDRVI